MLADRMRMRSSGLRLPAGYVMATDDDFSYFEEMSVYIYVGTNEYVAIPEKIDGNTITTTAYMFANGDIVGLPYTPIKGVYSNNSNVTNMDAMFYNSQATTLDLSNLDTSNVTSMQSMFYDSQVTTVDLSGFNTSNVTDMGGMFAYSQATSLDLSSFNTSNVTNMNAMFEGSQATSLDLSSFDTSNVTTMGDMFGDSLATTGYARTQADANKFNASDGKPSGLTFIVKP